ncbi:MAG: hypothetical protein VYE64_02650 [Planctomycetota bacterium]|nr:hypothetical protein [Planctomycetota bacterium]
MTDYEFTGETNWKEVTASEDGLSEPETGSPDADTVEALREEWELAKVHRDIVTSMIMSSVQRKQGDLCILGAGPCNDIEVKPLIEHFDRLVLVDLDPAAVKQGLARQDVLLDERQIQVNSVELTGIKEQLDVYARYPTPELMQQLKEIAETHVPEVETGKFSVVASTCMLSQLMFKAYECVAERDEDFGHLLFNLRKRHIELLLDMLCPGGTGLLITDFVSSESLPEILTAEQLQPVLQKGIAEKNFFHGMNPQLIHQTFRVPAISDQLESLEATSPWRWPTSRRVYACLAFKFQKKSF